MMSSSVVQNALCNSLLQMIEVETLTISDVWNEDGQSSHTISSDGRHDYGREKKYSMVYTLHPVFQNLKHTRGKLV